MAKSAGRCIHLSTMSLFLARSLPLNVCKFPVGSFFVLRCYGSLVGLGAAFLHPTFRNAEMGGGGVVIWQPGTGRAGGKQVFSHVRWSECKGHAAVAPSLRCPLNKALCSLCAQPALLVIYSQLCAGNFHIICSNCNSAV